MTPVEIAEPAQGHRRATTTPARPGAGEHGYGGYTSYASLNDLTTGAATCSTTCDGSLDRHVKRPSPRTCTLDLAKRLKLDSLWINILQPGAAHSGHIHPHSVISGTLYVEDPAQGRIRR